MNPSQSAQDGPSYPHRNLSLNFAAHTGAVNTTGLPSGFPYHSSVPTPPIPLDHFNPSMLGTGSSVFPRLQHANSLPQPPAPLPDSYDSRGISAPNPGVNAVAAGLTHQASQPIPRHLQVAVMPALRSAMSVPGPLVTAASFPSAVAPSSNNHVNGSTIGSGLSDRSSSSKKRVQSVMRSTDAMNLDLAPPIAIADLKAATSVANATGALGSISSGSDESNPTMVALGTDRLFNSTIHTPASKQTTSAINLPLTREFGGSSHSLFAPTPNGSSVNAGINGSSSSVAKVAGIAPSKKRRKCVNASQSITSVPSRNSSSSERQLNNIGTTSRSRRAGSKRTASSSAASASASLSSSSTTTSFSVTTAASSRCSSEMITIINMKSWIIAQSMDEMRWEQFSELVSFGRFKELMLGYFRGEGGITDNIDASLSYDLSDDPRLLGVLKSASLVVSAPKSTSHSHSHASSSSMIANHVNSNGFMNQSDSSVLSPSSAMRTDLCRVQFETLFGLSLGILQIRLMACVSRSIARFFLRSRGWFPNGPAVSEMVNHYLPSVMPRSQSISKFDSIDKYRSVISQLICEGLLRSIFQRRNPNRKSSVQLHYDYLPQAPWDQASPLGADFEHLLPLISGKVPKKKSQARKPKQSRQSGGSSASAAAAAAAASSSSTTTRTTSSSSSSKLGRPMKPPLIDIPPVPTVSAVQVNANIPDAPPLSLPGSILNLPPPSLTTTQSTTSSSTSSSASSFSTFPPALSLSVSANTTTQVGSMSDCNRIDITHSSSMPDHLKMNNQDQNGESAKGGATAAGAGGGGGSQALSPSLKLDMKSLKISQYRSKLFSMEGEDNGQFSRYYHCSPLKLSSKIRFYPDMNRDRIVCENRMLKEKNEDAFPNYLCVGCFPSVKGILQGFCNWRIEHAKDKSAINSKILGSLLKKAKEEADSSGLNGVPSSQFDPNVVHELSQRDVIDLFPHNPTPEIYLKPRVDLAKECAICATYDGPSSVKIPASFVVGLSGYGTKTGTVDIDEVPLVRLKYNDFSRIIYELEAYSRSWLSAVRDMTAFHIYESFSIKDRIWLGLCCYMIASYNAFNHDWISVEFWSSYSVWHFRQSHLKENELLYGLDEIQRRYDLLSLKSSGLGMNLTDAIKLEENGPLFDHLLHSMYLLIDSVMAQEKSLNLLERTMRRCALILREQFDEGYYPNGMSETGGVGGGSAASSQSSMMSAMMMKQRKNENGLLLVGWYDRFARLNSLRNAALLSSDTSSSVESDSNRMISEKLIEQSLELSKTHASVTLKWMQALMESRDPSQLYLLTNQNSHHHITAAAQAQAQAHPGGPTAPSSSASSSSSSLTMMMMNHHHHNTGGDGSLSHLGGSEFDQMVKQLNCELFVKMIEIQTGKIPSNVEELIDGVKRGIKVLRSVKQKHVRFNDVHNQAVCEQMMWKHLLQLAVELVYQRRYQMAKKCRDELLKICPHIDPANGESCIGKDKLHLLFTFYEVFSSSLFNEVCDFSAMISDNNHNPHSLGASMKSGSSSSSSSSSLTRSHRSSNNQRSSMAMTTKVELSRLNVRALAKDHLRVAGILHTDGYVRDGGQCPGLHIEVVPLRYAWIFSKLEEWGSVHEFGSMSMDILLSSRLNGRTLLKKVLCGELKCRDDYFDSFGLLLRDLVMELSQHTSDVLEFSNHMLVAIELVCGPGYLPCSSIPMTVGECGFGSDRDSPATAEAIHLSLPPEV